MKKNVAGQVTGAQMVSASDGSAFTGSVTVYVTGDAGTQTVGSVSSGACTHEGNGYHTYAPAQAETNYDQIAFTFTGTGAVPVTIQVYTNFPQTGDSFARIGSPAGASVSADIADLNNISSTEVNTEVANAIVTYRLDHLIHTAVTGTDVTDNSIIAKLVSKSGTADWDSYNNTTDSVEALRDRGDAAWVTGGGGSSPQLLQSTTIATLASQTSFTLTAGSADDDAYNNALAIITDQSTSTQKAVGFISDYTGSSKTVTLLSDPGIFTIATGDTIDIVVGINQKFPSNFADMAVAIGTGWVTVGTNQDKTGYEIFGTKTTLDDLNDIAATAIVSNGAITTLSGAVVNVDTVDTCTTNTDLVSAASIRSEIDSNSTQLAAIVADTNELQTDWADGGRLDTIVDSILTDTGTTLETHLTDIKGGTFSGATDSLEAIRDRGDAAWTTGAGGTPPQLLQSTTIATLASQTSFTLTAGSADDDAYNGAVVVITDQSTSVQKAVGTISDYTGSTKTITLSSDPAIFTMAVGDTVQIIAALGSASSAPTAAQIRTEIDSNSTKLAAIKAKTDQLTFTDTNKIDATIQVAADIKAVVANKLADHVVRRSLASALASSDGDTKAFRSLAGAVSKLVNKTHPDTVDNTKLNIYETDDTTVLGAQTMTKDSSASPVTGLDTD